MDNQLDCIHKPSDCLLLVSFPLTEVEFLSDLETSSLKDYAKTTASQYKFVPHYLWLYQHLPLVNVIHKTAIAVEKLGVTVKLHTTLSEFKDISSYQVVTLVSHFKESSEEVELSDQLHCVDEIVANVDNNFTGIFDLSVCNSVHLQDKLKTKFGDRCFVRANKGVAEIKMHLILYKTLIRELSEGNLNYLSALLRLRILLNNYIQQKT